MWSIAAVKKGKLNSRDIHIDRDREPYIFIKLDEKIRFPAEVYQFDKALVNYLRTMYISQSRIDDILTELQPIELRLGGKVFSVVKLLMGISNVEV